MTRNLGLAGAADLFGTQLGNDELAILELDLYAELASVRPYDDALRALESLKRAGLKVALCSNLATPYAIPAKLLLPEFDAYAWSFEVGQSFKLLMGEPSIILICRYYHFNLDRSMIPPQELSAFFLPGTTPVARDLFLETLLPSRLRLPGVYIDAAGGKTGRISYRLPCRKR